LSQKKISTGQCITNQIRITLLVSRRFLIMLV